jgi:hypothetical protein
MAGWSAAGTTRWRYNGGRVVAPCVGHSTAFVSCAGKHPLPPGNLNCGSIGTLSQCQSPGADGGLGAAGNDGAFFHSSTVGAQACGAPASSSATAATAYFTSSIGVLIYSPYSPNLLDVPSGVSPPRALQGAAMERSEPETTRVFVPSYIPQRALAKRAKFASKTTRIHHGIPLKYSSRMENLIMSALTRNVP